MSGVIGNTIAIRVLTSSASIRKTTSCTLLVSQSYVDLLTCCTVLVELFTARWLHGRVYHGTQGHVLCLFWASDFVFVCGVLISSYNLTMLSVDRAVSIRYPVFHRRRCTRAVQRRMAAVAWLCGLTVKLAMMVPTTGVQDGYCRDWELFPDHKYKKAFGICLLIFSYLLPVSLLAVCYYSIYLTLRRRKLNSEQVIHL